MPLERRFIDLYGRWPETRKHNLGIHATCERMTALGSMHVAECLEPLLSEAVKNAMAPHAFLDHSLEIEYKGRAVWVYPASPTG